MPLNTGHGMPPVQAQEAVEEQCNALWWEKGERDQWQESPGEGGRALDLAGRLKGLYEVKLRTF